MTAQVIMIFGVVVLLWAVCGTTIQRKPAKKESVSRPNQVNSPENLKKILAETEEEPLSVQTYRRLKESTERNKNNVRFN